MLDPGTLQSLWDLAAAAIDDHPSLHMQELLQQQMEVIDDLRQSIADQDLEACQMLAEMLAFTMEQIIEENDAEQKRLEHQLRVLRARASHDTNELDWLLTRMVEADESEEEIARILAMRAEAAALSGRMETA